MKQLKEQGQYALFQTKRNTKVLKLNDNYYVWLFIKNIGNILIKTKSTLQSTNILSTGRFYLFDVKDEPDYIDLLHLELGIGENLYQGYLLPRGLPKKSNEKHKIIPTKEVIFPKATNYEYSQENLDLIVKHNENTKS